MCLASSDRSPFKAFEIQKPGREFSLLLSALTGRPMEKDRIPTDGRKRQKGKRNNNQVNIFKI